MNPLAWLTNLLEKRYGLTYRRYVTQSVLGRPLTVIDGSLRTGDYDDAWNVALARRSRIVFDVGANVGQSALLMFLSGSPENIVLFEANPLALSIAAENLIRNNFSQRATFIPGFVSDSPGDTIRFNTVGAGAAGSIYARHAVSATALHASIDVPTITLDNAVELTGLTPDYVKIDVEGAEARVLSGFARTARSTAIRILVEMHANPDLSMGQNATAILDWSTQVGYRAWYLKDHIELKNPHQIASRGRCHLLLLPAALEFPGYLLDIDQGDSIQKALEPFRQDERSFSSR